jgi:hypothetical protein
MTKIVLGLSVSLALAFLMSPAMAAASPSPATTVVSVADQAFLASLAAAPAGAPAPEPAARRPAIRPKSYCSANCVYGGTVSCTGTTCTAVDPNCPTEPGHVTCDGVTTVCPGSACCEGLMCNGEDVCAAECDPCPYTYTCNQTLCTEHCRCDLQHCLQ